MTREETIQKSLMEKFQLPPEKVVIKRIRRIFAEVPQEKFREVFSHAVNELKCSILLNITGFDDGESIGAMYHLAGWDGLVLNLKTFAPKEKPVFQTISETFPGGAIYEREIVDLLGAVVEGLPEGKRYPLPDNWPPGNYPLRKDWNAGMLPKKGEGKNG